MKQKKTDETDFLTIYNALAEFKPTARNLIMQKCGFSKDAFYRRLKSPSTCSPIEAEAIAAVLHQVTKLCNTSPEVLANL